MKRVKVIAALMVFVMFMSEVSEAAYVFSSAFKENPQSFTNFLWSCTDEERILLVQSLKDLPSLLKDEYFGSLEGLPALDKFASDNDKLLPKKPETFNEVPAVTVLDAVRKGIIAPERISVASIRKALVWRAYNKLTYYFRSDENVDYHDIVKWAAEKAEVNPTHINSHSTYYLESKIAEKYFEDVWAALSHEKRVELLKNIEKETGVNFDIATISVMGGTAALGTIQSVIVAYGLPVIMAEIGYILPWLFIGSQWLITPVLSYLGYVVGGVTGFFSSPIGWVITGPIGITVTGGLAVWSAYLAGRAEKETVTAFILTVHMIKSKKFMNRENESQPGKR